ncbi:MAG TPA: hypothetical protein VNJ46_09725 [Gaiellaceae bacterium]|nr:hypothetical protein [Gaiellaceae bacterium]
MTARLAIAAAAAGLGLLLAPAASGRDDDVLVRGVCTQASTAKLKLSEEDGRIEVELEIDQNRNGVRWTVVLRRGARVLARATRVTRPPSGSFELRRVVANLPGPDRLSARATSRSGEVCRAAAVFRG